MKHLKNMISPGKWILLYVGRLLCSPFLGIYEEIKTVLRRPRPTHWRASIVEDIRLFWAPVTGAISGVGKALHGTLRTPEKH